MIELKSWSHFFQAIKAGKKLHDLRFKGDRTFKVGDILRLKEYDPFRGVYTGDIVDVEVTFITDNVTPCAFSSAVLPKDYCILSIRKMAEFQAPIPKVYPGTNDHIPLGHPDSLDKGTVLF